MRIGICCLATSLVCCGLGVAASALAQQGGEVNFAPGVLTTIEPELDRDDALSIHDIVEIRANSDLQWQPHSMAVSRTLYEMAQAAAFPQEVWCLELSIKPLRMIYVDVPQSDGTVQRKLIWYLVYRVRNTGAVMEPMIGSDGAFETKPGEPRPLRFVPKFLLVSQDQNAAGERVGKAYLDRVIPAAMEIIRRRELPNGELLNSVEIAEQTLPVESGRTQRGVWGVAMWEDVDPEMDFFSVFVRGLTNAYRWSDPEGAYTAGSPPGEGRQWHWKVLQINYWRPGDEIQENEREIRLGTGPGHADLYDTPEGVATTWTYR